MTGPIAAPVPLRTSPLAALACLLALASTLALGRAHRLEREIAALEVEAPSPPRPAPITLEEALAPIDVNRASPAELERLPRIGPALAARIVAHRPFRTLDELERVPGIGPRTLEALRPHATVGDPR